VPGPPFFTVAPPRRHPGVASRRAGSEAPLRRAAGEGVCGGESAACRVPRPLSAADDARESPPARSSPDGL